MYSPEWFISKIYILRHVNIKKAETKEVWIFNVSKTGLFKDFAPQIGLSENRKKKNKQTFFYLILLSSTEKNPFKYRTIVWLEMCCE